MPYNIQITDNTKGIIVESEETGFRDLRSAQARRKELVGIKEAMLGYSLYEAYYKKSSGYNAEKEEKEKSILEYYYAKSGNRKTVYQLKLYDTDYPDKNKIKITRD